MLQEKGVIDYSIVREPIYQALPQHQIEFIPDPFSKPPSGVIEGSVESHNSVRVSKKTLMNLMNNSARDK